MDKDDSSVGGGRWKLSPNNLLATSDGRDWCGIAAEKRRHSAGEIPEMIADRTVVCLALRGNSDAVIHRRGNGVRQATRAVTGAFWLCPRGVVEDQIRITAAIPEMLHLYLPQRPFDVLSRDEDFPDIDAATVNYDVGLQDPWITEVGRLAASELARETSSGRLLVETAALALAASLAHRHASVPSRRTVRKTHALDDKRLARVIDFIEANLDADIGVDDLAGIACLSRFHFVRAFKAATGTSPHRYVGDRRLERAKTLLQLGHGSLTDLALTCRFSSQANFARAFRRAVGMTPGEFRRMAE